MRALPGQPRPTSSIVVARSVPSVTSLRARALSSPAPSSRAQPAREIEEGPSDRRHRDPLDRRAVVRRQRAWAMGLGHPSMGP